MNDTPQNRQADPDESSIIIGETPSSEAGRTEFLKGTDTQNKDMLYKDLFQKNEEGDIVTGKKGKRSPLEIFTLVMKFVTPLSVILAILGGIHVFLKGQTSSAFAENYPFICPYLNYDIHARDDKGCNTPTMLESIYTEKQKQLEANIINQLSVYIPIKVSTNIINASSEKTFIVKTYENKTDVRNMMDQFETVRKNASSISNNNIICSGINITDGNRLSTQCTVYGGDIGAEESPTTLASARVEALHFLEKLANTPESNFILENPPTLLAIDIIKDTRDLPISFKTQTTIPLSLRYVSASQKN